jgi:hypothetical protein
MRSKAPEVASEVQLILAEKRTSVGSEVFCITEDLSNSVAS